MNFVRVCGAEGMLPCEVAMNPMPVAGRRYNRDGASIDSEMSADKPEPLSELNNIPAAPTDEEKGSQRTWINPLTWFRSSKGS